MLLIVGVDVDQLVHGVLIAADHRAGHGGQGEEPLASMGRICSGLVQIAFWSRRIRLAAFRARVIDSGFDGVGEGGGGGVFCGSGASGSAAEVVRVRLLTAAG